MGEQQRSAEQKPGAVNQQIELNDLSHELSDQEQKDVQGGYHRVVHQRGGPTGFGQFSGTRRKGRDPG